MAYSKKSSGRTRSAPSRKRSSSPRTRKPVRRASGSRRASASPRTVKIVIEHVQGAQSPAMPFNVAAPQTGPRKGQF